MSEKENVAAVQRAYDAFKRGDFQTILGILSDDIEWITPKIKGTPFRGPTQGKNSVAEFFRMIPENEEMLKFEPSEFIAQGDLVAVRGDFICRIKATGREATSPWVHIFSFKDGKVARFFELYDTAEAERAYQQARTA